MTTSGAKVLALAICTRHSFIQIFKASDCSLMATKSYDLTIAHQPFLLLAIEDYFTDPSQDCLARLFDAVNSMDLSAVPLLTRQEKLVMRCSERKDIFAEKFIQPVSHAANGSRGNLHKPTNSGGSYSSFEEGLLIRNKDKEKAQPGEDRKGKRENGVRTRTDTESSVTVPSAQASGQSQGSPSDSSFTLGGSAVWVGDESGLELAKDGIGDSNSVASMTSSTVASSRKRRSTGASSSSSQAASREHHARQINASHSYYDAHLRHAVVKDTHFYHTTVTYRDHPLPIKMPLATFPEEVGDVCHSSFCCLSALTGGL